ncbi:MAG: class I SAM-dependent methyltransferase [Xanthomonadales bacterium]|nr:class I SAM-dependent methyltransferase [Xanthomonadales bacterium]
MADGKRYDRDYFDRWYRRHGINRAATLARKVALAVACAEYHLGRPLASVLDVGCGEGAWRAPLRRLRPGVEYLGLDSSDYAIERFGRSRNLHEARFGDLSGLRFDDSFDLVVCADVLHYLDDVEVRAGLPGLVANGHGLAWLEAYCAEDEVEGDLDGFHARPADWYRRAFADAGLVQAGSHCWLLPGTADLAVALERAPAPRRSLFGRR